MMDLFEQHNLRRVINACGKMTALGGARVLPEVAEAARHAMGCFFELDALQAAAGRVIARCTGAEDGCVTACTAAGITLGVAATMTGVDLAKIWQLPDTTGLPRRVLIQKGHCVNYGQPITQAIRLAGAEAVEVGVVNRCTEDELRRQLDLGDVASVVHVESHHTVRYGWIRLPRVVALAHAAGVPVVVDGAAQDLRFRELTQAGADLVICSAHKFLDSTTGGVVAGRRDLVAAVYLQNRGIGRAMKAGKEAIVGAMAALQFRERLDVPAWTAEQDRKVELILELLRGLPGVALSVDPDPNGCPFSRVRLSVSPEAAGCDAAELTRRLAAGNPTVVARAHHAEEGYIHLDAIDLNDEELRIACRRTRECLNP